MKHLARVVVLACACACAAAAAAAPSPYLRQPDLHGDRIVVCAEGDLWTAPAGGGIARRLTSHAGTETLPRFSPDGTRVAFTAEYDGNADVYVVSADGGEPVRLTWHPAADEAVGWTPDGRHILFRSSRENPHGDSEMFSVPAEGGDPVKLPLGWVSDLDVDPASGRYAFTRSSWTGATWKRYRGGTAPDLWIGDPKAADYRKVTTFPGIDEHPMWHGGRIWFLSDQGGTMNLWSILPDGSDRTRHTDFGDWDARWPGMSPDGRIALTVAGDVKVFEPSTGQVKDVDLRVGSDRPLTRVRYPDPERTLTWVDLSPEADRIAVTTRGEVFSVPVKEGITLPVTRGSGARESWASFDGSGEKLVLVTDAPGEEEIRIVDAWGRGQATTVVPAKESGWNFPPRSSPDGAWIAWGDQTQTLWVVPAAGGAPRRVDRSPQAEIREYAWSPDGRWLAYSKVRPTDYAGIFLYDTKTGTVTEVTGSATNDSTPAWDPDGRWLYFLSDRDTNPVLDTRDWQNVEVRNRKVYLAVLKKDGPNPFLPKEGAPPSGKDKDKDGTKKDKDKDKEEEKDKPPKPVEIDLDGLAARVVAFPMERGSYAGLGATKKKVFFLSAPIRGMADGPGLFAEEGAPESSLMAFDLEEKKADTFLAGVSSFQVASKADKVLVMQQRGKFAVLGTDAPPGGEGVSKGKVSLADVVIELDPREEWAQIYREGWRHMRDFFWDPGLGGVDWAAVRDRYATLLPRLATRDDLRDLMGEVIGELNNSHTYVWGGDGGGAGAKRVPTGLLGADLAREKDGYRVVRILRADPADNVRSPLDEPGSLVAEGDLIRAVNHAPFPGDRPFEAALAGRAGKPVILTVSTGASAPRDVVVVPLPSEGALRYADWVRRNREEVARRSGGKIGYVHLPNMWTEGLVAFNTWFYPQLDREGMIVDVRWNGGGAVSQMILERLRRRVLSFDRSRAGGIYTYPARVLNGPFVVLTNEFAGSDGDIFPAAVQLEKLAPVIGMRSWGGVVGIRGDKRLVDGGMLSQPEYAWWDPQSGWDLENRGVVPDIEVPALPQDVAKGVDRQLDRAIEELARLRAARPPVKPDFGPARPRTREAFRPELAP